MINKLIHFIWIGTEIPSFQKKIVEKNYKTLYKKDYNIVEWDLGQIHKDFGTKFPLFVEEAINNGQYAIAVDYFRLLIIYKYGGIYIDYDHELLRVIPDYVLNTEMFVGRIPAGFINNGFFGAKKESPIIAKILSETVSKVTTENYIVGPRVETLYIFGEVCEKYKECKKLPSACLYPFFPGEKTSGITKRTFATHWFAGSWMKKWYLDLCFKFHLPKLALFIRRFTEDNKHF